MVVRSISTRQHPLQFGGDVILSLPFEALLVRFEVGDAIADLLSLRLCPIHQGRHPIRLNDSTRHRRLDTNTLRKRFRVFDEPLKIGFPIRHGIFLERQAYRHMASAAMQKV
jgi:hypothetical protein